MEHKIIGLSDTEIDSRKKVLYTKYYGNEVRSPQNLKQKWTPEDSAEMHELDFRNWCNSCLIYGSTNRLTEEDLQRINSCTSTTTLELYEVTLSRALEIIEEQKERFKTAKVHHDVYTDCEGVTYNSCDWDYGKK